MQTSWISKQMFIVYGNSEFNYVQNRPINKASNNE